MMTGSEIRNWLSVAVWSVASFALTWAVLQRRIDSTTSDDVDTDNGDSDSHHPLESSAELLPVFPWEGATVAARTQTEATVGDWSKSNNTNEQLDFLASMTFASGSRPACPCCQ